MTLLRRRPSNVHYVCCSVIVGEIATLAEDNDAEKRRASRVEYGRVFGCTWWRNSFMRGVSTKARQGGTATK